MVCGGQCGAPCADVCLFRGVGGREGGVALDGAGAVGDWHRGGRVGCLGTVDGRRGGGRGVEVSGFERVVGDVLGVEYAGDEDEGAAGEDEGEGQVRG